MHLVLQRCITQLTCSQRQTEGQLLFDRGKNESLWVGSSQIYAPVTYISLDFLQEWEASAADTRER